MLDWPLPLGLCFHSSSTFPLQTSSHSPSGTNVFPGCSLAVQSAVHTQSLWQVACPGLSAGPWPCPASTGNSSLGRAQRGGMLSRAVLDSYSQNEFSSA